MLQSMELDVLTNESFGVFGRPVDMQVLSLDGSDEEIILF